MALFLLIMSYVVTLPITSGLTQVPENCTSCYDKNCTIDNCYIQCLSLTCPEGYAFEAVNSRTCQPFPENRDEPTATTSLLNTTMANSVGTGAISVAVLTTDTSTTSPTATALLVSSCYKCLVINCSECPIDNLVHGCTRCVSGSELIAVNGTTTTCVWQNPESDRDGTMLVVVVVVTVGAVCVVVLLFVTVTVFIFRRKKGRKQPKDDLSDHCAVYEEVTFHNHAFINGCCELSVRPEPITFYDDEGIPTLRSCLDHVKRLSVRETLEDYDEQVYSDPEPMEVGKYVPAKSGTPPALFKMEELTKSLAFDINQDLSTDSTISFVEADRPVAPPTLKTVFGTRWQFSGTFTSQGGTLQASGSDIVLTVPPRAVANGEVVDIFGAIFLDSLDIRNKFNIPDDESLVSPLVEYIALPTGNFKRNINIQLPHALPPDFDTESVKVYTFNIDDTGTVVVSCLPFRGRLDSSDEDVYWEEDRATNKICIFSSHFRSM